MRKTRQILGFAAVALVGTVARLDAQPLIDFHGFVAGCFTWTASVSNGTKTACVEPTPIALPGGSGGGLTSDALTDLTGGFGGSLIYSDDSFWGTAIGLGAGNAAGINNPASNGSFGTLAAFGNFDASHFTNLDLVLKYYFDADVAPGNTGQQFTPTINGPYLAATLTGHIISGVGGNTTITFDPPVAFSFTNGGHTPLCNQTNNACVLGGIYGTGTITGSLLQINGSSPTPSVSLTGSIAVTSVAPEPGSIALFATGLVGMVPVIRYRRRKQA